MKNTVKTCASIALSALIAGGAALAGEADYTADLSAFAKGTVNAGVSVHDPSIVAEDGAYYIFGSHMAAAKSEDLRVWKPIANGYRPTNPVWGNLFGEGSHVFDYAGSAGSLIPTDDGAYHVWAPDVIYNDVMGKYCMYYCTSSTWNASNLCWAVSDSVTGPYEWQGPLVCSGFDKRTMEFTDVCDVRDAEDARKTYLTMTGSYNYTRWPNALDPAVFFDAEHRLWMVYGSWSGGIFLLELDPATGKVIHPAEDRENGVDPYFGKHLMGGNHKSIEGPYILYDAEAGYYYLFVSYGELRAHGGYQIRVFRSKTPDGEYTDMLGAYPDGRGLHAPYGLKLSGNYNLPSLRLKHMATGHNSAMIDADGKRYICSHTRFDNGTENHQPLVKQYLLNAEGWPCVLPYAAWGETVSENGYGAEKAVGRWYVINQGIYISDKIAEPFILYFRGDGTVDGDGVTGAWKAEEGGYRMTVSYGNREFSGVFCAMKDNAGTEVFVFSAVGANESLWGVKYDD